MKENRIVATERSEYDRRIQHLTLTPKGRAAIRVLEDQSSRDVRAMIDHVKPANQRKLVDALPAPRFFGLRR